MAHRATSNNAKGMWHDDLLIQNIPKCSLIDVHFVINNNVINNKLDFNLTDICPGNPSQVPCQSLPFFESFQKCLKIAKI